MLPARKRLEPFPFAALVGLEDVRSLLVMALVNPAIGPVAVTGPPATGKSTAIRGLADLLPDGEFSFACPSNCPPSGDGLCDRCSGLKERRRVVRQVPLVRVPFSASLDDMLGRPLRVTAPDPDPWERWEPGLLALANGGLLIVERADRIAGGALDNLLATVEDGRVTLKNDGLRFSYPCRCTPVLEFRYGCNGDREQQFPGINGNSTPGGLAARCRFAAHAAPVKDIEESVLLLKRVQEFETAPQSLREEFADATRSLRELVAKARAALPSIRPGVDIENAARIEAAAAGAPDAWRALLEAARAEAALEGKPPAAAHIAASAALLNTPKRGVNPHAGA